MDGEELRADAWCGQAARGTFGEGALAWSLRRDLPRAGNLLAPVAVDLADWRHPEVGWGVVLPDRTDISGADKAAGADAPEPIRRLLQARAPAPVLRYDPTLEPGVLRRYDAAGNAFKPGYAGDRGVGSYAIPRYLLIVGSPAEIPWGVQYRMQLDAFVGRLDLEPAGLAQYVEGLLSDWRDARPDRSKPVIWSVDHGYPDITRLMRKCIAERVQQKFETDPDREFDTAGSFLSDGAATQAGLRDALAARRPAFVLTTSHGATFPLDDLTAMRSQLGLPVDRAFSTLDLAALADGDSVHGAIWYAHACCSAGSDAKSKFAGMVGADSKLGQTLEAIAQLGACSAPLPQTLLGGSRPLRAFIGHVEPTFDLTLRESVNGEVTTHHIVQSLYNQLHLDTRPPVGLAMQTYFREVAGLLQDHLDAIDAVNAHQPQAMQGVLRAKLKATDRLATVLLGDPTVRLPAMG